MESNKFIIYAKKARERVAAAEDGIPKINAIIDVIQELEREDPKEIDRSARELKAEFRKEIDRQVSKISSAPFSLLWLFKKLFGR